MTSGGADSGPNAGSNLVQGVGTNTATFTLPGSPRYKVESVVASVNNAAGGDTTGTLTVADQSGQVVAAVEQGRVITSGVTGRATWSLRLNDEQALIVQTPYVQFVLDVTDGIVIAGETNAVLAVLPDSSVGGWTVGLHVDVVVAANAEIQLGATVYSTGIREFFLYRTTVINMGAGTTDHLSGNGVFIHGPDSGLVSWDTHDSGTALLSLTTPKRPKFVAGGTYSINANVTVS